MNRTTRFQKGILYFLGLLLTVVIVTPFLWPFSASLQNEGAIYARPPAFVPDPVSLANYDYVFTGKVPDQLERGGLLRSRITQEARLIPMAIRNSFLVAFGVIILNLTLGTVTAYTFARERFRGQTSSFIFILGSRLLPAIAIAVPIFMMMRQANLLDTKFGLILIHAAFTLPFTIWVLTLYFRSLPLEMEEAALVDGCTRLGALRHVALPLALPALAAVGVFSFLFSYNEFLFALFTTSSPATKTIPVVIASIAGNPDASYTLIATGIALAIITPMTLALIFRRYITSGLAASMTTGAD